MATYNIANAEAAFSALTLTDGDIINIGVGTASWTANHIISKAVTINGAGAGRCIARSTSSVAVGTGTKVFVLNASAIAGISNGVTLQIERTGTPIVGGNATGVRTYMIGTVSSYTGTSLTMNITSTAGSGTETVWMVSTISQTIITNNNNVTDLFTMVESTVGQIFMSGIEIDQTANSNGSNSNAAIGMTRTNGGYPIAIHDCYFISVSGAGSIIRTSTNRGVVYNSTFASFPFSLAPTGVQIKDGPTDSWTTASTMGTADTNGTMNFYIENCDFEAWLNCMDFDDNSRTVVRQCVFNNAGVGSHGADTSNYGNRHFELYDSTFIFNGFSNGTTMNLNWWFYIRGGTGVITNNVMPHISSTDYGSKADVNMTTMQLQRNAGPNGGWGVINTSGRSTGWNYPAPRQVGFGRVTAAQLIATWLSGGPYPGPGATWSGNLVTFSATTYKSTAANTSSSNPSVNTSQWLNVGYAAGFDSVTYIGDSEPLYIWNNSGSPQVGLSDYGANGTNSVSTTATPITCDSTSSYVQLNRDYFFDTSVSPTNGAKPGWSPSAYPNPWRQPSSNPVTFVYKRLGRYLRFSGLSPV